MKSNESKPHPFFEGPEIKIYFNRRPLGFKIKEGDNGLNAIIASIDDRTHDDRIIGTQITEINEFDCTNAPFDQITSRLQNSRLPLQIVFQHPPRVNVFPRPRCAGKILPERESHPHTAPAPANRTYPNISPQVFLKSALTHPVVTYLLHA